MFKGSLVALVTPFKGSNVDEAALRGLVNWQIEQGTHGIVPVGTTGESPTLSETEHTRVVEIVVEEAAGRVPIIAGAGSNNTAEAIHYTKHAARVGADAVLHVAGYYNRPNQEGLYQHFKALSEQSELPIIVYNIPPRAIVDISPDTMARMAQLPRIIGVKDATADLSRPARERLRIKSDFCYLSGEDGTAVAYNAAGGNGCISVSANVAPALCAQLQEACLRGDYGSAMEIQQRLMPLHEALFIEPSPAGAKYAASLLGHCDAFCRLPVVELTDETKQIIRTAMTDLGLL
ncbi:MAG: 4-hydroxy-tetrahydrodipicolinate synthase [Gammaproteobacteria bacterium]|nr:4-hydroxy-tetrahydrodipicolinate synthase [Gammaproteobacteria bacterium]